MYKRQPFGHAGERYLSACYHARTGRYFNHNVHSVRVLDQLYRRNVSLQTLDGVLCHNCLLYTSCLASFFKLLSPRSHGSHTWFRIGLGDCTMEITVNTSF